MLLCHTPVSLSAKVTEISTFDSVYEFRRNVRIGAQLVGTFIKLPVLESVDLAASAGFDFVAIDLEHSQIGFEDASALVRHAFSMRLPALVRIPEVDAPLINKLLEVGAAGVQLSSLRSTSAVVQLIAACRYSPGGQRSVSGAQPSARYGAYPLADYLDAESSDPPLIIGQIESATTDDPLAAIFAAGLDLAFIGPTDLSVDLGAPGRIDDSRVAARIGEIAAAAAKAAVRFGGFSGGIEGWTALKALGASYFVVGSDLQSLQSGLATLAVHTFNDQSKL